MVERRAPAPATARVRAIAGFGAPGAADPVPMSIEAGDWSQFLALTQHQRITGLAVAATEAGVLRLTEAQRAELVDRHGDAMAWDLLVERTLLDIADAMETAGLPYVILKGPSLAHTAYPDPAWRGFGDLDVLVRAEDWRSACRSFTRDGAVRDVPEPRRGFDERFGKATVFRTARGVDVDLHLRLALGPYGLWIETGELFAGATPMPIADRTVPRSDDTSALMIACVHAVLGSNPPRLVPLRDVVQLVAGEGVDWTRVARLTRRWRLGLVVRHALETASSTLHVSLPDEAGPSLAHRATADERRLLGAYTTPRRFRGAMATSTLRAIPGWGAKAAYLRALVLPDQEFLRVRTGSPHMVGSLLQRWTVAAGWLRRASGNHEEIG